MKYITDTDYLPEYRDIHFDSYQLLYGITVNHNEGMIYDTIITLCRRHREDVLRKSKIDYWQSLVKQVIINLNNYIEDRTDVMVYIPYKHLLCSCERLVQRYIYAQMVLENVRGLEMNKLERRGKKSIEDIQWFYPIKKLDELMYDSVPYLAELHKKPEDTIRQIIQNELIRRGIIPKSQNPSFEEENQYINVLLNGKYLKNLQPKIEEKDDIEIRYDKQTKLESVGFLYYALQFYFNQVHSVKKERIEKILEKAVIRIANGLETPTVKYDGSNCCNNTIYKYVNKKTFNCNSTKYDTLKNIREALSNHGIKVPKELEK